MKTPPQINIMVLGDAKCGKTAFVQRYILNTFNPDCVGGFDVLCKMDGETKVNIIDHPEDYRKHLVDINGVILMFDMSSKNISLNINKYLNEIDNLCKNKVQIIIVGAKNDMSHNNMVVKDLSKIHKLEYFEVSSKTGFGIEGTMEYLIDQIKKTKKKLKFSLFYSR